MARWGNSLKVGAIALGLSGCASMPPFDAPVDEHSRPTVSTIIDEIQCEIADARDNEDNPQLKDFKPFGQWTAAVTLTLTVDDSVGTATAGLPLSFINTLSKTATFTFGLSPTLYQLRTRTYTQTYTINIASIPDYSTCKALMASSGGFNLEGELGLKDQIYMGLHPFRQSQKGADYYAAAVATKDHPTPAKTADTFGATIFFNVYYGVNNLGPTWTLATFKGPTSGVGYVRNDLHQIVISFAPAPLLAQGGQQPKPPKPPSNTPPPPPQKPALLDGPRPQLPTGPRPSVAGRELDEFNAAEKAVADYDNAERSYNEDLLVYSTAVIAYTAEVREYEAKIAKYTTELSAYTQAGTASSAGDAARTANQTAATVQAIQSLGQTLNRP